MNLVVVEPTGAMPEGEDGVVMDLYGCIVSNLDYDKMPTVVTELKPEYTRGLIAAAPDLLRVLKAYFDGPDLDADVDTQRLQHKGWVRQARAAIAKAEVSE